MSKQSEELEEEESNETSSTRGHTPFEEDDVERLKKRFKAFRIIYEDPWLYFRAMRNSELKGGVTTPKAQVWFGDQITLNETIPARLLGETYTGKHGIEFTRLSNIEAKMHLILNHTHWGFKLQEWARGKEVDPYDAALGKNLIKRIRSFLHGGPDTYWRQDVDPRADPQERIRTGARAKRFLELLSTVDGIFFERFLCFPDELWNWERFDRFTIGNIDALLGDEFLDYRLKDEVFKSITPLYTLLKKQRKMFKFHAHARSLDEMLQQGLIHPWLEQMRGMYEEAHRRCNDRSEYLRLIGILDQTRCCGKPPDIVVLKSKFDTIVELSTPVEPVSKGKLSLLQECLDMLLSNVPDEALTGLATHATLRVTTAACWETTMSEGGTASAINDIVWSGNFGRTCIVRDLQNGTIVERKKLSDCTVGEYIFWRSLEEVLSVPPDELSSVWLVMVEDPGKARTVTKGRACLKVVYDVINKLCSRLLTKGVESSRSGMEKSSHAWEFFKTFFKESREVFKVHEKKIMTANKVNGKKRILTNYEELFCSSTDYKSATDKFRFEIAEIIGDRVMRKMGIPKLLMGIVKRISFKPRKVFFMADGPIENLGDEHFIAGVRFITTTRGILMGDPLTKVLLHVENICTRILSGSKEFTTANLGNPTTLEIKIQEFIANSYVRGGD